MMGWHDHDSNYMSNLLVPSRSGRSVGHGHGRGRGVGVP
jgi:hypothetical protein